MANQPQPNVLLRYYGLKRSGNHGISRWLRSNLPYQDLTHDFIHNDVYGPDYPRPKIHTVESMRVQAPTGGNGLLVVSYEDVPVQQIPLVSITEDDHILEDAQIRDVLILRDPFNMAASRLTFERKRGKENYISRVPLEVAMERWKDYAREFKRIRDGQPSQFKDPVIINYNEWKSNQAYRDALLRDNFGVRENLDIGINDVAPEAFGSSSDGMRYQGKALQMRTGERWQNFIVDPRYRAIFRDSEFFTLSTDIFGHIPGTERLWSNFFGPEGAHRSPAERR